MQAEVPVIAMEDTVARVDRDEKIGRRGRHRGRRSGSLAYGYQCG